MWRGYSSSRRSLAQRAASLYGLPMDAEQERIFCYHIALSRYVARDRRRGCAIVGRQAGKDRMGSVVQGYEAARAKPEPDGTEVYSLSVAQDHRASLRTAFMYATAPFGGGRRCARWW